MERASKPQRPSLRPAKSSINLSNVNVLDPTPGMHRVRSALSMPEQHSSAPLLPTQKKKLGIKNYRSMTKDDFLMFSRKAVRRVDKLRRIEEEQSTISSMEVSVLCGISPTNCLRAACIRLVKSPKFDQTMMTLIILNCCLLMFYDPMAAPDSTRMVVLDIGEYIFNSIFMVEMMIKILAMGFISRHDSYMRISWNVLDFVVVVGCWIPTLLQPFGIESQNVSSIRIVRVLKALRTIPGVPGMRALVSALLASIPMLIDVIVLLFFMFFVFGIVSIQFLKGALTQRCSMNETVLLDGFCSLTEDGKQCPSGYSCVEFDPVTGHRNPNPNGGFTNFDNLPSAFLTIFTAISLEGWTDVMYWVEDAYGSATFTNVYFVILITFGALFVVNLVVAVICDSYDKKAKEEGLSSDTPNAEDLTPHDSTTGGAFWAIKQYLNPEEAPRLPRTRIGAGTAEKAWFWFRRRCYVLVTYKWFVWVVLGAIVVNCLLLGLEHYDESIGPPRGMDPELSDFLAVSNVWFTFLFLFEMLLKMTGLGMRGYLSDSFNRFDVLVVAVSLMEMFAADSSSLSAFRALRLMRVFKLARSWTSLRKLIETVFRSGAGLVNFLFILLIFIMIYSLVGMQIYGGKFTPENGFAAVPRANFDGLANAIITVFQVLTGENWNEVMYDTMRVNGAWGSMFTLSMFILGNFIALNLFLAILLENFEGGISSQVEEEDEESLLLREHRRLKMLTDGAQPKLRFASVWRSAEVQMKRFFGCGGNAKKEGDADLEMPALTRAAQQEGERKHWESQLKAGVSVVMRGGAVEASSDTAGFLGEQGSIRDFNITAPAAVVSDVLLCTERLTLVFQKLQIHMKSLHQSSRPSVRYPLRSGHAPDRRFSAVSTMVEEEKKEAKMFVPSPLRHQQAVTPPPAPHGQQQPSTPQRVRGIAANSVLHWLLAAKLARKWPECVLMLRALIVKGFVVADEAVWRFLAKEVESPSISPCAPDDAMIYPLKKRKPVFTRCPNRTKSFDIVMKDVRLQELRKDVAIERLNEAKREKEAYEEQVSLCCLTRRHPIRRFVIRIVGHSMFDTIIYILIGISSLALALDSPSMEQQHPWLTKWLNLIDFIVLVLFILEAVLKITAMGFAGDVHTYMHDPWNKLDFAIVLGGIVDLTTRGSGLEFIRAIRVLRALRPLRFVGRSEGLKIVVTSVLKALPPVMNVALIALLFMVVFGIVGVQFFKGKFAFCHGDPLRDYAECFGSAMDGTDNVTLFWANPPYHFDNLGAALLTLFEVASLEMWPGVMNSGADVTEIHKAPQESANPSYRWYFVLFIIVAAFFIVNLFVGVVIDKFSEIKDEMCGSALLSEGQKKWVETQRLMLRTSPAYNPIPSGGRFRRWVFSIVTTRAFDITIVVLICLNTLTMATHHVDENQFYKDLRFFGNFVFLGAFFLEAAGKIYALRFHQYWSQMWNRFDFFIVIGSIIGLFTQSLLSAGMSLDASVLRAFRVARLFRLVKRLKGLQALFETLLFSLPSLLNVATLLILVLFIFAVTGMQWFGGAPFGEFIHLRANFDGFWTSILLLFRCATGESWNGIMHDLRAANVQPDFVVILFFVLFTITCSYLLLNLLVAVILENFSDIMGDDEGDGISAGHIQHFAEGWSTISPQSHVYLPNYHLATLMHLLPPPLGFKGVKMTTATMKSRMLSYTKKLNIPTKDRKFFYLDALYAFCGTRYNPNDRTLPEEAQRTDFVQSIAYDIQKKFPTVQEAKEEEASEDFVSLFPEFRAASKIQSVWSDFLDRRRSKKKATALKLWSRMLPGGGGFVEEEGSMLSGIVAAARLQSLQSEAESDEPGLPPGFDVPAEQDGPSDSSPEMRTLTQRWNRPPTYGGSLKSRLRAAARRAASHGSPGGLTVTVEVDDGNTSPEITPVNSEERGESPPGDVEDRRPYRSMPHLGEIQELDTRSPRGNKRAAPVEKESLSSSDVEFTDEEEREEEEEEEEEEEPVIVSPPRQRITWTELKRQMSMEPVKTTPSPKPKATPSRDHWEDLRRQISTMQEESLSDHSSTDEETRPEISDESSTTQEEE